MSNNPEETANEDKAGAILILVFIALLVGKALGVDMSWWLVTSPLWVPTIYLIVAGIIKS